MKLIKNLTIFFICFAGQEQHVIMNQDLIKPEATPVYTDQLIKKNIVYNKNKLIIIVR